jgi:hypothetical protein
MNTNNLAPIIIVCFVAWRIVIRVRRNIGRQPLQPRRMVVRIVIYAAVTILIAAASVMFPRVLIGLGGGLALGALLALVGIRLTQFETSAAGRFYTPNPYLGTALSILLVGRLAYRLMVVSSVSHNAGPPPAALTQSGLSFCFFGMLAGYYIAYYTGLLMRSRPAA